MTYGRRRGGVRHVGLGVQQGHLCRGDAAEPRDHINCSRPGLFSQPPLTIFHTPSVLFPLSQSLGAPLPTQPTEACQWTVPAFEWKSGKRPAAGALPHINTRGSPLIYNYLIGKLINLAMLSIGQFSAADWLLSGVRCLSACVGLRAMPGSCRQYDSRELVVSCSPFCLLEGSY